MKINKSFFRRGLALTLGLAVLAPAMPVFAQNDTVPVTINVMYQNFTNDGITVMDPNDLTNNGKSYTTVKSYTYNMPAGTEVDLLNNTGLYVVDNDTQQADNVNFSSFEGMTIYSADAQKYRAATVGMGGTEETKTFNLHYTRNVYSIYVDPMGGENTVASSAKGGINNGEEIKEQYDFPYGANIENTLKNIWSSEPIRGVKKAGTNEYDKNYNDDFVDWHREYRLLGHTHASKCDLNKDVGTNSPLNDPLSYLLNTETVNGKMPAADITFRAHYSSSVSPVTVVYNLQNANDNEYSIINTKTINLTPGASIVNYRKKGYRDGKEFSTVLDIPAVFKLDLKAEASLESEHSGSTGHDKCNIFVTGSLGDIADVFLAAYDVPKGETRTIKAVIGTHTRGAFDISVEVTAPTDDSAKPVIGKVTLKNNAQNQMLDKRFDWTKASELKDEDNAADTYTGVLTVPMVDPDSIKDPVEVDIGGQTAKIPVKEMIELDWEKLHKDGIIGDELYDERGYYSYEYCDAFEKKNANSGEISYKTPLEVTTVKADGTTVVNVYYTRNYYALQFHMAKEIDGSKIANTDYAKDPVAQWGVSGHNWAVSTLTRSRNGYISTNGTYDWKKDGSSDPNNSSDYYNAFGTNNGVFSWGNNWYGGSNITPNYVFLNQHLNGSSGDDAEMPSIEAGGVKASMSKRSAGFDKEEYTIIARYGAEISDYWPIGDKLNDATKRYTWDKHPSTNSENNPITTGETYRRYSMYTWHTNYDTLYHASRINNQNIIGMYDTLDKQLIVQDVQNRANTATPEPIPTPKALTERESAALNGTDNVVPEDIFTPEAMGENVSLGTDGEFEEFVVDNKLTPDGTYFDPEQAESNSDYGSDYEYNEDLSLMAAEEPSAQTTVNSTTAKAVKFENGAISAKEPIYLAAPKEDSSSSGFSAKTPDKSANHDSVTVSDTGYKHDLVAYWSPDNRNWKHMFHFYFEDADESLRTGNSATVSINRTDNEQVNVLLNGNKVDRDWRTFPATLTDQNGNSLALRATSDFRDKYGLKGQADPEMPNGFNEGVTFYETAAMNINTVGSNMAQNAPEKKGYRLYYIGHTNADDYTVRPFDSKIGTSDIYMFYVPERYEITYVAFPGQNINNSAKAVVKYGQLVSTNEDIAPMNGSTDLTYTRETPFGNYYIWKGWYLDPGFVRPVDFENSSKTAYEGNVNYYGKWELPKFTVTFNMNGFRFDDSAIDRLKQYGDCVVEDDKVILYGVVEGTKAEDLLGAGFGSDWARKDGANFDHWEEDLSHSRYGFGASQYITQDLTVNACTPADAGYVCYILHADKSKTYYTSISNALKDYTDSYKNKDGTVIGKDYKIVMVTDTKENVDINSSTVNPERKDPTVYLDFDGYVVTGNFTTNGYNFVGIDSKTDRFEQGYSFGSGYGGIVGSVSMTPPNATEAETTPLGTGDDKSKVEKYDTNINMPVRDKYYEYSYVCVPEDTQGNDGVNDSWSFHRVYCDVWMTHVRVIEDTDSYGNKAQFGFGTAFYGDAEAAKQIMTSGNGSIGKKMYNSSPDMTLAADNFGYNVQGAFFANEFYGTEISANSTDVQVAYALAPTITNYGSVSEGIGNGWKGASSNDEWVYKQLGFSLDDAITMIAGRYGHTDRIGADAVNYLGNPEQYSDTSDSASNTAAHEAIYDKDVIGRLTKWQGLAKNNIKKATQAQ